MNDIGAFLKDELLRRGADLVGFGDLAELPIEVREGLPAGVCVAVKYPKEVIRGIAGMPTREYYEYYDKLNERLDMLVTLGAGALQRLGYQAVAKTRAQVAREETEYGTLLPHKTVATRAGIGWIGKCALLVTPQYGSMVRISSILTDAPLQCAQPVNESRCGECMACADACPGGAVLGKNWDVRMEREMFYDAIKCRRTARARALQGFGVEISQCGKCVEVCPYTRNYLEDKRSAQAL
jgi:epoxyqueuosine reductase QueG